MASSQSLTQSSDALFLPDLFTVDEEEDLKDYYKLTWSVRWLIAHRHPNTLEQTNIDIAEAIQDLILGRIFSDEEYCALAEIANLHEEELKTDGPPTFVPNDIDKPQDDLATIPKQKHRAGRRKRWSIG